MLKLSQGKTRGGKALAVLCSVALAVSCCFGAVPKAAFAQEADGSAAVAAADGVVNGSAEDSAGLAATEFTAAIGEISGPEEDGYHYFGMEYVGVGAEGADEWGYVYPEEHADLYTLTLPAGTQSVTIAFGEDRLAYAYDANGGYLAACGEYGDGKTGKTAATVSRVGAGDAFPSFVRVQTPYDESWNSTTLYAIAIVCESGSGDEPVPAVNADFAEAYEKTTALVVDELTKSGYAYGNEWLVVAAARAGQVIPLDYYSSVVSQLNENDGKLHSGAGDYTNYAKTILALTAAGFDATDVGGYDLTARLADYESVTKPGVNGAAYALLALDSHSYEIPQAAEGVTQATRANLVQCVLDKELAGGGWAYSGTEADPDMTAIALQALAPYGTQGDAQSAALCEDGDVSAVQAAIDRGVLALSALQDRETGGYTSWGSANSCSSAQVVIACVALGIDPDNDSRFVTDAGKSALDGLLAYAASNGGFGFQGTTYDALSTQQGACALAAYDRFAQGGSLFAMDDVEFRSTEDADRPDAKSDGDGQEPAKSAASGGASQSAASGAATKASAATGDTPFALVLAGSGFVAAAVAAVAGAVRRKEQEK